MTRRYLLVALLSSVLLLAGCGSLGGCVGCPETAEEAGFPVRVNAPKNDPAPTTPPPR